MQVKSTGLLLNGLFVASEGHTLHSTQLGVPRLCKYYLADISSSNEPILGQLVAKNSAYNLQRQERSQKAEKVMHIKGRLPDQAAILFNCAPFQNGNFSWRKEFAPRGSEFFSLILVPYGMENHFYHNRWSPLNVTFLLRTSVNAL